MVALVDLRRAAFMTHFEATRFNCDLLKLASARHAGCYILATHEQGQYKFTILRYLHRFAEQWPAGAFRERVGSVRQDVLPGPVQPTTITSGEFPEVQRR